MLPLCCATAMCVDAAAGTSLLVAAAVGHGSLAAHARPLPLVGWCEFSLLGEAASSMPLPVHQRRRCRRCACPARQALAAAVRSLHMDSRGPDGYASCRPLLRKQRGALLLGVPLRLAASVLHPLLQAPLWQLLRVHCESDAAHGSCHWGCRLFGARFLFVRRAPRSRSPPAMLLPPRVLPLGVALAP